MNKVEKIFITLIAFILGAIAVLVVDVAIFVTANLVKFILISNILNK